jgi:6,7-dimethyl-8-ribityllumazine synthase
MNVRTVEPNVDGTGLSVGVALSTFNETITGPMLDAVLETLEAHGVSDVTVVKVPGALELPVIARALTRSNDAVVAVGAVVEGETDHYEHVATQGSAGLMQVAIATGVPVANALLTVREVKHAIDRSRPGPGNKGAEAAEAALIAARAIRELRPQNSGAGF